MRKRVFKGNFSLDRRNNTARFKMYDEGELILIAEVQPFELGSVVIAALRDNQKLCDDLVALHDIRKEEGKRAVIDEDDNSFGFLERLLDDDGLRKELGDKVTSTLEKLRSTRGNDAKGET